MWVGKPAKAYLVTASMLKKVDLSTKTAAKASMQRVHPSEVIGYVLGKADDSEWGSFVEYKGRTTKTNEYKSMREATEGARADFVSLVTRELRLESDPAFALEEGLKYFDWYYQYSDDQGVWRRWSAEHDRLRKLSEKIDKATADALWAKYSPKDENGDEL